MTERLHQPRAPTGERARADPRRRRQRAGAVAASRSARRSPGAASRSLRYDLPFRQASPTAPPRPAGAARDREGLRTAVAGDAIARRRARVSRRALVRRPSGEHAGGGRGRARRRALAALVSAPPARAARPSFGRRTCRSSRVPTAVRARLARSLRHAARRSRRRGALIPARTALVGRRGRRSRSLSRAQARRRRTWSPRSSAAFSRAAPIAPSRCRGRAAIGVSSGAGSASTRSGTLARALVLLGADPMHERDQRQDHDEQHRDQPEVVGVGHDVRLLDGAAVQHGERPAIGRDTCRRPGSRSDRSTA